MIKTLFIKYTKNYILKQINLLLQKNKDDVMLVCSTISSWIMRLQLIVSRLERINDRCKDGKLDDIEVEESISDILEIVDNWK